MGEYSFVNLIFRELDLNNLIQPDSLQEVNAQPQNTLYNLFKDDMWTQKFKDLLKERDYVVIKTEQMQGLLLSVFARRKHLLHLRQVETEYTRTGLGGIWVSLLLVMTNYVRFKKMIFLRVTKVLLV